MKAKLEQATTDAQRLERDKLTHAAWGEWLSLEKYLERERRLRAHAWSRSGLRSWQLVDADVGTVLASCETYRMNSEASGRSGVTEGIASVFVEEHFRGKGYASSLMDLLRERVRSEGGQALILFSEVPPKVYERSGFVSRPIHARRFQPLEGQPSEGVDALISESGLRRIDLQARQRRSAFEVRPTVEQLDWHLERARIYAELLGLTRPEWVGAHVADGTALWTADLRHRVLRVLLLRADSLEGASKLMGAARRVAKQSGLREVVLWEREGDFAWNEGESSVLDDVPMICPLAEGIRAEDWNCLGRVLWV